MLAWLVLGTCPTDKVPKMLESSDGLAVAVITLATMYLTDERCARRQLPIFTFVNKLDRPALEPLEIIDQLEKEFGLKSYPVNWPIGSGDRCTTIWALLIPPFFWSIGREVRQEKGNIQSSI